MENCLIEAFAKVLDTPVSKIIELLGHNGKFVQWPNEREPFCYRGVHIQELVDVAYQLGYTVYCIEKCPMLVSRIEQTPILAVKNPNERFKEYLFGCSGILVSHNMSHAWVWDKNCIIDSYNQIKSLEQYLPDIDEFYGIKSFERT